MRSVEILISNENRTTFNELTSRLVSFLLPAYSASAKLICT